MTLIDADALIPQIVDIAHKINKSNADYSSKHFALCVLEDIERIIDEAPIIDLVKHGRVEDVQE